jgi:hypothetical protein
VYAVQENEGGDASDRVQIPEDGSISWLGDDFSSQSADVTKLESFPFNSDFVRTQRDVSAVEVSGPSCHLSPLSPERL